MATVVQAQRLEKTYRAGDVDVPAVRGVDFAINAGAFVAFVGPSGSGKSTLLNIIGALDRPTTGQVLFDDRDLATLDETELARIRNRQIGFVFQLHHLLPQCTVLENVLVPTLADKNRLPVGQIHQRAVELLGRVGLKDFLRRRPGELSGGQRQRVAVVRALMNKPQLVLADEPTGSLDRDAAENIADLLVELNRSEGVALIVVTHSLEIAGRVGHVMELSEGLLTDGGP